MANNSPTVSSHHDCDLHRQESMNPNLWGLNKEQIIQNWRKNGGSVAPYSQAANPNYTQPRFNFSYSVGPKNHVWLPHAEPAYQSPDVLNIGWLNVTLTSTKKKNGCSPMIVPLEMRMKETLRNINEQLDHQYYEDDLLRCLHPIEVRKRSIQIVSNGNRYDMSNQGFYNIVPATQQLQTNGLNIFGIPGSDVQPCELQKFMQSNNKELMRMHQEILRKTKLIQTPKPTFDYEKEHIAYKVHGYQQVYIKTSKLLIFIGGICEQKQFVAHPIVFDEKLQKLSVRKEITFPWLSGLITYTKHQRDSLVIMAGGYTIRNVQPVAETTYLVQPLEHLYIIKVSDKKEKEWMLYQCDLKCFVAWRPTQHIDLMYIEENYSWYSVVKQCIIEHMQIESIMDIIFEYAPYQNLIIVDEHSKFTIDIMSLRNSMKVFDSNKLIKKSGADFTHMLTEPDPSVFNEFHQRQCQAGVSLCILSQLSKKMCMNVYRMGQIGIATMCGITDECSY